MSNYKVEIRQDEYAESPREWDNLGTFIMQHGNYDFGDIFFNIDPYARVSFEDDFKYHLKEVENCTIKDVLYLPVYMLDHSEITIDVSPFSCSWDSGQIGYIYVTKEKIRKEYNVKRVSNKLQTQVLRALTYEIEMLDNYITGNVYEYTVYDENNEVVDSCGGFYGYDFKKHMYEHLNMYITEDELETIIVSY
jgi:hypothetical protein